jgi:hypothetical protein
MIYWLYENEYAFLSYRDKYAYAPYEFIKEYKNTYIPRHICYFSVEFYFLVGFLEKKLPLKIVQFIFAIVKEEQIRLVNSTCNHHVSVVERILHWNDDPLDWHPWDWHPDPDPDPEAAAEAAARAEARAEAKKNKKLWVKKKKEKLLEYKNRGLKR